MESGVLRYLMVRWGTSVVSYCVGSHLLMVRVLTAAAPPHERVGYYHGSNSMQASRERERERERNATCFM